MRRLGAVKARYTVFQGGIVLISVLWFHHVVEVSLVAVCSCINAASKF